MCKMLEDMRDETAKEAALENSKECAIQMLKDGVLTIEKIANYSNLPIETVKKLKEENALW